MEELISVLGQIRQLLENDIWEIVSIIISGVALLFAILVPVRIAKKQNNIALFEKRFEAYANLLKLKAFANMLKNENCSFDSEILKVANPENLNDEIGRRCNEVLLNFQVFFYRGEQRTDISNVNRVMLYTIRSIELSLHTLPMLYSKSLKNNGADANREITKIFEDLASFINSLVIFSMDCEEHRKNFIEKMNLFADKYSDIFEKGMRLK